MILSRSQSTWYGCTYEGTPLLTLLHINGDSPLFFAARQFIPAFRMWTKIHFKPISFHCFASLILFKPITHFFFFFIKIIAQFWLTVIGEKKKKIYIYIYICSFPINKHLHYNLQGKNPKAIKSPFL